MSERRPPEQKPRLVRFAELAVCPGRCQCECCTDLQEPEPCFRSAKHAGLCMCMGRS